MTEDELNKLCSNAKSSKPYAYANTSTSTITPRLRVLLLPTVQFPINEPLAWVGPGTRRGRKQGSTYGGESVPAASLHFNPPNPLEQLKCVTQSEMPHVQDLCCDDCIYPSYTIYCLICVLNIRSRKYFMSLNFAIAWMYEIFLATKISWFTVLSPCSVEHHYIHVKSPAFLHVSQTRLALTK